MRDTQTWRIRFVSVPHEEWCGWGTFYHDLGNHHSLMSLGQTLVIPQVWYVIGAKLEDCLPLRAHSSIPQVWYVIALRLDEDDAALDEGRPHARERVHRGFRYDHKVSASKHLGEITACARCPFVPTSEMTRTSSAFVSGEAPNTAGMSRRASCGHGA